ncbi:MAG: hypothetical protein WBB28_27315 [Crinalium sp.]
MSLTMMKAKHNYLTLLTTTASFLVSIVANPAAAFPTKPIDIQPITPQSILVAKTNWKEFTQKDFTVSFPNNPSEKTEEISQGSVAKTFTATSEEGYYALSYFEMPSEIGKLPDNLKQVFLEAMIDIAMPSAGAEVKDKESISLNDHPGMEFNFTYQNIVAGKGRVYLVGDRGYMLMSMTTLDSNSQKFFESFKLLN